MTRIIYLIVQLKLGYQSIISFFIHVKVQKPTTQIIITLMNVLREALMCIQDCHLLSSRYCCRKQFYLRYFEGLGLVSTINSSFSSFLLVFLVLAYYVYSIYTCRIIQIVSGIARGESVRLAQGGLDRLADCLIRIIKQCTNTNQWNCHQLQG